MSEKLEFIAEVGSCWKRESAKESEAAILYSISEAVEAGATIVKFQIFTADSLFSASRAPRPHQIVSNYEFPLEILPKAQEWAHSLKAQLWASVFSVDLLEQSAPYLDGLKIASGDLLNGDGSPNEILQAAVEYCKDTGKPLAVSTGAATKTEIRRVVFDILSPHYPLWLFHCVSEYPAIEEDYQLGFIDSFETSCEQIGLSDHTLGRTLGIAAATVGYTVFEKHFMLPDTPGDCPDAVVAIRPKDFEKYVEAIKRAKQLNRKFTGEPTEAEQMERLWARRGADGLRPTQEAVADVS